MFQECPTEADIFFYLIEYKKEQEQNNVLTVQHKVEEQMSEALIRECAQCATRFFKTEGKQKETFEIEHVLY